LVASCGVPYGSSEATNQLAVNTDVPVSTKSRQSQTQGPAQCACWQFTMWGIPVYLVAGDRNFQAYSIMTPVGSNLYYIDEFKWNANSSQTSTFFQQPILFMPQTMNVGDTVYTTNDRYSLDPSIRAQTSSTTAIPASVTLSAHYSTYVVPETGVQYNDVIYFQYNSNLNNNGNEQYWLANGIGKIRAIVANAGLLTYAQPGTYDGNYCPNGVETVSGPLYAPENPWYSPVPSTVNYGAAYVWNGSFENGLTGWTIGGETYDGSPISTPAQRTSVVTFTSIYNFFTSNGQYPQYDPWENNFDEAGPHQLCMQGAVDYNSAYTYVQSQQLIPVIPGATYELSGWLYRPTGSPQPKSDTDTIAFAGGWNSSGSPVSDGPTEAATYSGTQPTNQLYFVSTQVTMPADVYNTEIICSRTGFYFPSGNEVTLSYFDDVRLNLIALPSGYVIPGT